MQLSATTAATTTTPATTTTAPATTAAGTGRTEKVRLMTSPASIALRFWSKNFKQIQVQHFEI